VQQGHIKNLLDSFILKTFSNTLAEDGVKDRKISQLSRHHVDINLKTPALAHHHSPFNTHVLAIL
jgi:hypothetical protein